MGVSGKRTAAKHGKGVSPIKRPSAAKVNPYEIALRTVPYGEVVTFAELAMMAKGHPSMGALIHAGGFVRKIPTNSSGVPWWRAISTGGKTRDDALQVERAAEQRRRLKKEGVDLGIPHERHFQNLPRCLSNVFETRIIEPRAKHTCTLVYLHGRAFTGTYYSKNAHFFRAALADGLRIVLPTADVQLVGKPLTEWFPGWPPGVGEFDAHRARVNELLDDEVRRLGGRADRVFLGGTSQGCIFGLDIYMRYKKPLAGFCGIIGNWPKCSEAVLKKGAIGTVRLSRPLRMFNGKADYVVEWEPARKSFAKLKALGFDNLKMVAEERVGHQIGDREGVWIRAFLDEVLQELTS